MEAVEQSISTGACSDLQLYVCAPGVQEFHPQLGKSEPGTEPKAGHTERQGGPQIQTVGCWWLTRGVPVLALPGSLGASISAPHTHFLYL